MGKIYVTSDIHGQYQKYRKIFDALPLREEDSLFVLGDVVDRGPEPMSILLDMMERPNVFPLLGNHEMMALTCLKLLCREITEDALEHLASEELQGLLDWLADGGRATLDDFTALSPEQRQAVMEYFEEFSLYEELTVEGKEYLLVHAGLGHFSPEKKLTEYALEDLLLDRPDYGKIYFPGKYLVTGHTATRLIPQNQGKDRIYQGNHHIALDCGCAYDGPLGVFCLNDGREWYL